MKIFIARCPVTVGFIYKVLMFIKHTTCYEEMIGYVNQVWGKE